MPALRPGRTVRVALTVAFVLLAGLAGRVRAQSLTEGALRGTVVLDDGTPVSAFSLTLEDAAGVALRRFVSDFRGRFSLPQLAPGRYTILAEKSGYQPLRQHGIDVVADAATLLTLRVVRRPPPITKVEESAVAEQRIVRSAPAVASVLTPDALTGLTPRSNLTEVGRNGSAVAGPRNTTPGFATAFGGLPQRYSGLLVDGLPGNWFRHPALDNDVGGAPVYSQALFGEVQAYSHPADIELMGLNGGMMTAVSRRSSSGFHFAPYASWSGGLGVPSIQNGGDSSLTSVRVGGTVSGALIPDRARYIVGFDYQSLELPTANPWDNSLARFQGGGVALGPTIAAVAQDSFGRAVGRFVAPTVRHTRGGSGGFRVDWRLNATNAIVTRANFARYTEDNPEAPGEVVNGAGGGLDSRDFSSTIALVSTLGDHSANEFRFGIRRSTRDWSAAGLPTSYFVAEGAGIGSSPSLPGDFEQSSVDFAETFQYSFGSGLEHRVKLGVQYSNGHWDQDYLYGQRGMYSFGDLDGFAAGRGAFYVAEAGNTHTRTSMEQAALYGQVLYRLAPNLSLLAALRYDRQKFPRQKNLPIKPNALFRQSFGFSNALSPDDNNNLGPRLGLMYEGGRNREWNANLALSRQYGTLNPASYAEARLNDGAVTVRRGVGAIGTWPSLPDTTIAPRIGQQITLFSPNRKGYKNPRTFKADAELSRALTSSIAVRLYGGYHHTDFLLRRTDLNLLPGPTGYTQEGRPVYGTLEQEGGLLAATPGSNRAIAGFDLVSGLVSTGFQDYYEAGLSLSREATAGLSFAASYTFSRTRDNWLQSWTGDPTDALSPFPADRPGHEWAQGISDYDIPHRAVVVASWSTGGRAPVTVGARYRFRSGLPFTPGFLPGVDANGDGSGRNDPAFVDRTIPGVDQLISSHACLQGQTGKFAARNSCREDANHALDLSAAVGLPVASLGGRLEVTAEVLNLVSTPEGVVDRALVLVDPNGTLVTDAQGNVTLPLIANPRFGKFLSRRTEPRMVRFGLRVAY